MIITLLSQMQDIIHYFVDYEMDDKSYIRKDSERSLVYTCDYYTIKIKDVKT